MRELFFIFLGVIQSESGISGMSYWKIKNKDTESVVSALIKQSKKPHVLHRPIETTSVCGL
jgi:hypothetical protein